MSYGFHIWNIYKPLYKVNLYYAPLPCLTLPFHYSFYIQQFGFDLFQEGFVGVVVQEFDQFGDFGALGGALLRLHHVSAAGKRLLLAPTRFTPLHPPFARQYPIGIKSDFSKGFKCVPTDITTASLIILECSVIDSKHARHVYLRLGQTVSYNFQSICWLHFSTHEVQVKSNNLNHNLNHQSELEPICLLNNYNYMQSFAIFSEKINLNAQFLS